MKIFLLTILQILMAINYYYLFTIHNQPIKDIHSIIILRLAIILINFHFLLQNVIKVLPISVDFIIIKKVIKMLFLLKILVLINVIFKLLQIVQRHFQQLMNIFQNLFWNNHPFNRLLLGPLSFFSFVENLHMILILVM